MMNKDVYLVLSSGGVTSCGLFVEFTCDVHLAAKQLQRGSRVFKLNGLQELKEIDVTYTETTYE